MEVIQLIPPERVSERLVEQVVDVPVPQIPTSVACITSALLRLVVWRRVVGDHLALGVPGQRRTKNPHRELIKCLFPASFCVFS